MKENPAAPSGEKKRTVRRLPPLLLLAGAAAVVLLLLMYPGRPVLRVADANGATLRLIPPAPDGRFSVVFTHSHARSRVEEVFEIAPPDRFRLRETIYEDFGAGLPHEELPGLRMEFADGRIRLTGYDVAFRELQLRVGRIADHRIEVSGKAALRLADVSPPGSEVRLSVVTAAPWRLWFGRGWEN